MAPVAAGDRAEEGSPATLATRPGTSMPAAGATGRITVDRRLLLPVVEAAVVIAWVIIRTLAGEDGQAYPAWAIATAVLALVSPVSGLVVLGATAPFFEPATITRVIGWQTVIVVAMATGVLVRLLLGGWRTYPRAPTAAAALAVGLLTLGGVGVTAGRFDDEFGAAAAANWLITVGGAMLVLVASIWVFRDGERRPLYAAVGASAVAAILCLVEWAAPGSIAGSPIGWVGFWKDFGNRLAGVIASPNGVATLFVMPSAILVAAALLGSELRPGQRAAAAAAAAPLLLAMLLTLSRAALIAFLIFAIVFAWRIRRELGIAVIVIGLIGGLVLLPVYLQTRSQLAPVEGALEPGSVLVASDQTRFRAWGAAAAMFRDDPLSGQGFLSYRRLAPEFGEPILKSPHNEWLRLFAEEGVLGGLAGLVLVGVTLVALRRAPGWLGAGVFAGFIGYVVMASFNNPLLFIQISIVVFSAVAWGVAAVARPRDGPESPAEAPAAG